MSVFHCREVGHRNAVFWKESVIGGLLTAAWVLVVSLKVLYFFKNYIGFLIIFVPKDTNFAKARRCSPSLATNGSCRSTKKNPVQHGLYDDDYETIIS